MQVDWVERVRKEWGKVRGGRAGRLSARKRQLGKGITFDQETLTKIEGAMMEVWGSEAGEDSLWDLNCLLYAGRYETQTCTAAANPISPSQEL